MIYPYQCILCGKKYEVVQQMNAPHEYYCCGMRCERIWTNPHTNRDLMYHFNTPIFNNRTTEIHSKRQYDRLLKENKLVSITRNELQTIKPKDNAEKSRKETVKKVAQKLHSDGLSKHFPSYVRRFHGK